MRADILRRPSRGSHGGCDGRRTDGSPSPSVRAASTKKSGRTSRPSTGPTARQLAAAAKKEQAAREAEAKHEVLIVIDNLVGLDMGEYEIPANLRQVEEVPSALTEVVEAIEAIPEAPIVVNQYPPSSERARRDIFYRRIMMLLFSILQ